MSQFFEALSPGDVRLYIKSSDVLRIESPPGLDAGAYADPDHPIKLHMKDGAVLNVYGNTATRLLWAILSEEATCVFIDTPAFSEGGA